MLVILFFRFWPFIVSVERATTSDRHKLSVTTHSNGPVRAHLHLITVATLVRISEGLRIRINSLSNA